MTQRERLQLAALVLNGMISSNPVVDRTKVDKDLWARIAVEWTSALIVADAVAWSPIGPGPAADAVTPAPRATKPSRRKP